MGKEFGAAPRLPWRATPDGVEFVSVDGRSRVVFGTDGVSHHGPDGTVIHTPWHRVTLVGIDLPTSWGWLQRVQTALTFVTESVILAPYEVEISISTATSDHTWSLGRPRRYPWQLGFVLDEWCDYLERTGRLSALGEPGLLDLVAAKVVPSVPRRARPLINADLFGLDRRLGGHRAYDGRFAALLARVDG